MNRWHQLPQRLHSVVAARPDSVLLQTSRFDPANKQSLLFVEPLQTIAAYRLEELPFLFRQLDQSLAAGFYAAGFLSYECGYHFERFEHVFEHIHVAAENLPLAWFGIYRTPLIFDHETGCFNYDPPSCLSEPSPSHFSARFADDVALTLSREAYCGKIEQIKDYIRAGETYQVNFTDRVEMAAPVNAAAAFTNLLQQQPVAYSAFLNVAGHHILSLSPELFFKTGQGRITTRPMKGTMPRGLDASEDVQAAVRLQNDEKNRCEHVMIVDLLRNDLGRICTMGSVQVEDIFSVEHYETLLQMTSTVSGTLRPGLAWYDIFKGIFPSGSITGAPKIRTMQIIRELEKAPRGIYTGAIGFIAPDGTSVFNVAIRTLDIDEGRARMGVGGGIIADSLPAEEYRECMLKAEFLVRARRGFQLIETALWNGSYRLLSMHLDRMESSAAYFNYAFDRASVTAKLVEYSAQFETGDFYRVRLLLDEAGNATITHKQHANTSLFAGRIRIASQRTSSGDVFLRHKTTHRELYDSQYASCRNDGFDEVIFLNERDEITEGAISNIFIQRAGKLFTPPLRSGVLPGVFRRHLLETAPQTEEAVLTLQDLESAEAIYLCNSLRGLREVRLSTVSATNSSLDALLTAPGS